MLLFTAPRKSVGRVNVYGAGRTGLGSASSLPPPPPVRDVWTVFVRISFSLEAPENPPALPGSGNIVLGSSPNFSAARSRRSRLFLRTNQVSDMMMRMSAASPASPKTTPIAGLFCRKPFGVEVGDGETEAVVSSSGEVTVFVTVPGPTFVGVGVDIGVTSSCEET